MLEKIRTSSYYWLVTSKQIKCGLIALLTTSSFVLGSMLTHLKEREQTQTRKEVTRRILDNCVQAVSLRESLISNCSKAYLEAETCVSNLYTCDINKSKQKLTDLQDEKEILEVKIQEAASETAKIVRAVKENPYITK